jgi:hypothetical protein
VQIAVKRFDKKKRIFEEKSEFFAVSAQPLFCMRGFSPDALPVEHRG